MIREDGDGNGVFVFKLKNTNNQNLIMKTEDLSFQKEIWKTKIGVYSISDLVFDPYNDIFGCGFSDTNFYGTAKGEDMIVFKLSHNKGIHGVK